MIQVALLQFPRARLSNLVAETPSRGGELNFKAILDKEAVTYDRQLLLVGSRRNEVLDLSEARRYGIDSYGDADYVSIYGLSPTEWYRRGSASWGGPSSNAHVTGSRVRWAGT
ncbi:MAG TPA: hypothetical protein VIK45_08785 [Candidatus Dormibacteraeota bacterium]